MLPLARLVHRPSGDTISGGAEVFVNVTFSPTAVGIYSSSLEVDSDGGDEIVTLTGNSTAPSVLTITPPRSTTGT